MIQPHSIEHHLNVAIVMACHIAGLGLICVLAVLPYRIQEGLSGMRLKEKLTSKHSPEKIVWTVEDPFTNKQEKVVTGWAFENLRKWLVDVFRSGHPIDCPACGQRIQKYHRSIRGQMVKALAYAVANGAVSPQDMVKVQGGCGDYAKLRFWGFLEKSEQDGKWRATEQGKKFLRGEVTAAKFVYVFNDRAFGRSDEQIYVSDCAGKGFSLSEILDFTPESNAQPTQLDEEEEYIEAYEEESPDYELSSNN